MANSSIFSAADILIPALEKDSPEFTKWAVIACDQFTSDLSYWQTTESIIDGAHSTYDYILPEAYLGTELEDVKLGKLKAVMAENIDSRNMNTVNGYIFIERTLSNGAIRRGILGKLDLEEYDYSPSSTSNIRATEQTVPERIPPRSALRAMASVELPHAMIFAQDRCDLYAKVEKIATECPVIYDFDLMQGGGHIKGYAVEGEAADKVSHLIAENESMCVLPYAVGDGNHSLAAAKAHYENLKRSSIEGINSHPARYALCEIVSISDAAIEFEPIHRILKNVDPSDVINSLSAIAQVGTGAQEARVITAAGEAVYSFTQTSHDMTVGTLQNFIDEYVMSHKGAVCDYIHGEAELRSLVSDTSVAFMFDGFDKSQLFVYIKNGPMPRKTFSMGDSRSKRYYLEVRKIIIN